MSFYRTAETERCLELECLRTTSFIHVFPILHIRRIFCPFRRPISSFVLYYYPSGRPQAGGRAGPGAPHGSLVGGHAPGGALRGMPPQWLARALPRPGLHAPNLRRATERRG